MPLGDLTVRIGGDIDGFKAAMQEGSDAAEKFSKQIADGLSEGVRNLEGFGHSAGTEIGKVYDSFGRGAKAAAEAGVAIAGALEIAAKYSGIAAASGSTADTLANSYRALRIALSPTLFTAAAVGVSILIEESIKLLDTRGKLIEQEALMAAVWGRSIGGVEAIHNAADASGSDEASLQALIDAATKRTGSRAYNAGLGALGITPEEADGMQWVDLLARIATGFDSIRDPAERARIAVELFGKEHAGMGLAQLTPAFVNAAEAAKTFGTTLSSSARTEIDAVHRDIESLKSILTDFSLEKTWVQSIENSALEIGAAFYEMSKRGVGAIAALVDKMTGLGGLPALIRETLGKESEPEALGAKEHDRSQTTGLGLTADDLFAQGQGAAARKSQTFAGRVKAQEKAQKDADEAFQALQADQAKRLKNPNDPTLLTEQARFTLAVRQQSSSAVAGGLTEQIRGEKQAPELAQNQIDANRRISDSDRKTAENAVALARLEEQAQLDAMRDVVDRKAASAAVDLGTAQQKVAKLVPLYQQELAAQIAGIEKRAAAESALEGPEEKGRAQITAQRLVLDARAESAAKITALGQAEKEAELRNQAALVTAVRERADQVTSAWERSYNAVQKKARETFIQQAAPGAFNTLANQASEEILAKGKGQTDAEAIQTNKIALERAYGLEVVHTQAERLSFERQIADFDAQARNAKIAGLQKELELAATAMADSEDGSEKQVSDAKRVAELYNQIAQARAQANNADSAAQSKLAIEKNNQTLGAQIKGQFGDGSALDKSKVATAHLVKDSVDGIASALARAAVQGKGLGQIFSQLGKQLAISALTSALKIGLESGLKALTPLATAALAAVLKLIPAFGAVATAQAAAAATKKAVESAAAAASVTSAAGEGAAWGFESVMAALPFPVNVAVAPVVAATTFAQIMGFGAPAAFAEGGEPPLGVPSLVGERGPELFIPHQLGTIIPNHQLKAFASSGGSASSISSSSSSASQTNNFNIAGANNPRETARAVAQYLKTASPQFSRFAH
jgi:hypothetical protein